MAGEKLQSILVTEGKTQKCIEKYGKFGNDPRCLLTCSPSGWFTEVQILQVLEIICRHAKGAPILCIWDAYRAHFTPEVLLAAEENNVQLLKVPEGLTWALQPLDVKVFGPYKQKLASYWMKNSYNEDKENYHLNLCDTLLSCYDDLKKDIIDAAFTAVLGDEDN